MYRINESNADPDQMPVVPSLASSVPSIIANSSPSDQPMVARSRSNADGEEPPPLSPPPPSSSSSSSDDDDDDDTNRTNIRQPADGLGNPSTVNLSTWRTSNHNEEQNVLSWSSNDDDDDDDVPPSARLRPVLIGGEDNTQSHHSNDDDLLISNLSLNTNN